MTDYLKRIRALCAELGIPEHYGSERQLSPCVEAEVLTPLGLDCLNRDQFAEPNTAAAWSSMRSAAAVDGVVLQMISAFRSVDYQAGIIRRKLDSGKNMAEILLVSAAPGYSEHHTGRAIDITTPNAEMLEESFEMTLAFVWLNANAGRFGFVMSYPRGNPAGIAFEPWHWYFDPHKASS